MDGRLFPPADSHGLATQRASPKACAATPVVVRVAKVEVDFGDADRDFLSDVFPFLLDQLQRTTRAGLGAFEKFAVFVGTKHARGFARFHHRRTTSTGWRIFRKWRERMVGASVDTAHASDAGCDEFVFFQRAWWSEWMFGILRPRSADAGEVTTQANGDTDGGALLDECSAANGHSSPLDYYLIPNRLWLEVRCEHH